MTCEDCGAEASQGLCVGCAAQRVKQARAAAIQNAKFLTDWALKNTHGPGEALLSLMTAFMIIHVTASEMVDGELVESPVSLWVARAQEILSTLVPKRTG